MRVAPALREDRGRERGLKLIKLRTEATLYPHLPGVHLRTTFENTAQDHRLRAHLKTGIHASTVMTDSAFDLIEQPAEAGTRQMQSFVSLRSGTRALSLVSRGLPEYEAVPEDDQVTLALTLVRAVGWLSRDDLSTREGAVGPMVEVPGAQCLREMDADYALIETSPGDRAAMIRAAAEFQAPLQALQYDVPPRRRRRSYLSIVSDQAVGADSDGAGAILTAFKPPEKGNGWVVRLINPLEKGVEVYVTPFKRPLRAYLMTMAEEPEGFIELDANGRIGVHINPHEVITLLIFFDDDQE
jgi:alpha-mannosidase